MHTFVSGVIKEQYNSMKRVSPSVENIIKIHVAVYHSSSIYSRNYSCI